MTKPFENKSTAGNEKAVRLGRVVPKDGVNLAYVNVPQLNPEDNIVIVDTSRVIEDNALDPRNRNKIYYANGLGVLVDENGRAAISDQYPAVTDIFSIDEDWSKVPGSEYTDESILPWVHVSRPFHVDHAGLTLGSALMTYEHEAIKVVDSGGREYLTDDGQRRYRIRIAAAQQPGAEGDSWAYRVHAYVDTDENTNLFLMYNKIEVATDSSLKNHAIGYTERLNLQPLFDYRPEESEVVDPANRDDKIYSTKPVDYKAQVLGKETNSQDGYRIFVPKKAIGDPRVFQLFRWRLNCTFKQSYKMDPTRASTINCGVIVTNKDLATSSPSRAPYALYNLERSQYNATNVVFKNPLKTVHTRLEKEKRSYWFVNIDDPNIDLSEYDLLLWAPNKLTYDFSKYRQKLENYQSNHNGTVFIDTNSFCTPSGLGMSFTSACTPGGGKSRRSGNLVRSVKADSATFAHRGHNLINGDALLGGWQIGGDGGNYESDSMSHIQGRYNPGYTQFMHEVPDRFTTIMRGKERSDDSLEVLTAIKNVEGGREVISTFAHLFTCSALFSHVTGKFLAYNMGGKINTTSSYSKYINSTFVEGAMKLLFNVALLSVRNRTLDSSDEQKYSTTWTYSSEWKSSWVIDGEVLSEPERDQHLFSMQPRDLHAEIPDDEMIWKRRLTYGGQAMTAKALMNKVLAPILNNKATQDRVLGATRTYDIEITNPYVHSSSVINESDYIYAYTDAYSPAFDVPVELGPHVIKEEKKLGEYENATYSSVSYPDKKYACQVFSTFVATEEDSVRESVTWTATGTADETIVISEAVPASSTTKTTDVRLSWADDAAYAESIRGNPDTRMGKADGIHTWQEHNYYTSNWGPGHKNWPYWGMRSKHSVGDRGERVSFIQEALNLFRHLGFINSDKLRVDGYYGPKTANAVTAMQNKVNARYVDGVVDAESWFLIGSLIIRAGLGEVKSYLRVKHLPDNNYRRFFGRPQRYMNWENISNDDTSRVFAKRSWRHNGPSVIWDLFSVTFAKKYKMHAVTVVPYLEDTPDMMVRSIDVRNSDNFSLHGYNSWDGKRLWMPFRPKDGQTLRIPFGPYYGDQIIIGMGQDRGAGKGWGTARMFGVRDIYAHARVTTTTTIPAQKAEKQQLDINLVETGTESVSSFKTKTIQLNATATKGGKLSNIRWTNVTTNNPKVIATITQDGKLTLTHNIVDLEADTKVRRGRLFPGTDPYWAMDENKNINGPDTSPIRETGYINKADGIKLLCTKDKKPIGFPTMPTAIGDNEYQRHYVKLSLATQGTASDVQVGFYDLRRKEFIVSASGKPEISYIEYMLRGPQNIFIGVTIDPRIPGAGETVSIKAIPVDEDAPLLPFKWAMPVYGVQTKVGSRISLQPLPANLGVHDLWPVAVREGNFNRKVRIRSAVEGNVPLYLSNYQGQEVHAFYGIPEAESGGYSTIYGPPHADVRDEEPIILDDDLIQVRQTPIHMVQEPTVYPGDADPVRPVFTVSKRVDRASPWVEVPWTDIKDWNVAEGHIYLKDRLTSDDSGLIKVDYTTTRRHYYFKKFGDDMINLNMYPGHSRQFQNQALYIYMMPEYVRAQNGMVIAGSVNEKTLRMTTDPTVFDPLQPEYDPLIVQLGVVYTSTALDPADINLLDTRTRGGGVPHNANMVEVLRLVREASAYWDVNYAAGTSYQKGGYVVIRLPEQLKNEFTANELHSIIERNITAGVGFKIEDLTGNDWL